MNQKILEYLNTIPSGKVETYKHIGKIFGIHPRAVARIMSANKKPDTYACYKVIRSDGGLGGYNLGIEEKIKRLENDGIIINNGKIGRKYLY